MSINDVAFDIDDAIVDGADVVGRGRQRQQVRTLLGVPIQWPLLGLAMHADVGDVGQPPDSDFVEMFQGAEGPAVQQAFFGIIKRPLHFALGLAAADAAGPRA